MSAIASPVWLAYAFGVGVALSLVDRALKVRWLGKLFLAGGLAILAYAVFLATQSHEQGLWIGLKVFGLLAAGYAIADVAFLIGRGVSK